MSMLETSNSDRSKAPAAQPANWLLILLLLVVSLLLIRNLWEFARDYVFTKRGEPREITPRGDLAADEKSTIELFRQAAPSAVYISTTQVQRNRLSLNLMEIPQGSGTGFVWDQEGHIVTNFHVVASASRAYVRLSDGTELEASLVGAEPDKDIVVLRITAPPGRLTPIKLGTSHDLEVGQKVFAIGNPFGLDQTLTTGVISGLERQIEALSGRSIAGVIQTDAAINPGNSGGPLLDSAGRLIGVNTAIVSPSGTSAGVGFAVPVDVVNRVVPDLIAKGSFERPGLGVVIAAERIATRLGVTEGALILEVGPNSAAAAAGLIPTRTGDGRIVLGDIILSVDGKPVKNRESLIALMEQHQVGEEIKLQIRRGEEELEITATLQAIK